MQGLEEAIGVSVVHPTWQKTKPDDPSDEHCGWTFAGPDDPPFQSPSGERCLACSTAARGVSVNKLANAFSVFMHIVCEAEIRLHRVLAQQCIHK